MYYLYAALVMYFMQTATCFDVIDGQGDWNHSMKDGLGNIMKIQ